MRTSNSCSGLLRNTVKVLVLETCSVILICTAIRSPIRVGLLILMTWLPMVSTCRMPRVQDKPHSRLSRLSRMLRVFLTEHRLLRISSSRPIRIFRILGLRLKPIWLKLYRLLSRLLSRLRTLFVLFRNRSSRALIVPLVISVVSLKLVRLRLMPP